jgi:fructokinase
MRLGIDLGGTKIEIIALDGEREVYRRRIPTPRGSYRGIVEALATLVRETEAELAAKGHAGPHSVGIGIPGSISPRTGLAMNANSTEINGQPLQRDLEAELGRPVRFANDANCLAVSEAVDGAGAGKPVVYAVIIGTGTGSGIAIHGQALIGAHGIGGEVGHNPLPWPTLDEVENAPACFCGQRGCIETWVAGPSFARDYAKATGRALKSPEIVAEAVAGDADAQAALDRYISRLARFLASIVNLIDPDVIVLGGGMSHVTPLYARLPDAMRPYVFSDAFLTPILPAKHGDSSGVRGAAWLWNDGA